MKNYLVKVSYDIDGGDNIAYGTQVINESEKRVIDEGMNKLFAIAGYEAAETPLSESIEIIELSENDLEVLNRLGLNHFGCEIDIDDLEGCDNDSDDEDDDED